MTGLGGLFRALIYHQEYANVRRLISIAYKKGVKISRGRIDHLVAENSKDLQNSSC
jgi:RNA:NAD 2'-phosphotransferase (TPT1/KptA family)